MDEKMEENSIKDSTSGKKKADGKLVLLRLSLAVCLIVFVVSGFMLIKDYWETSRQQETFDELSSRFAVASAPAVTAAVQEPGAGQADDKKEDLPPAQSWKHWWEGQAQERFSVYQSMKKENGDMIGWIKIEGTNIDYPVMHTPDRKDYYLHRDFKQSKSSYGTPYLSEECRYEDPRSSLLISGHHMKNGSMFAALQNYTEKEYFLAHPYVQFDTMDEAGSYEVVTAFKLSASGDPSIWQDLLFPQDEGDFQKAWEKVKQQQFYDTGIELHEEDELLALLTCEYTLKDGRILVVARRITD